MEYRHRKWDELLYAAREVLREPDCTNAIYLKGYPGSGKTFVGRQLAEALELNYGYLSLDKMMPMSPLTGYADAQGVFHHTDYTLTVTHGGVMMFDEADNTSRPWIVLGAPLANRLANINGETVKVHPKWIPIFSGNTWGRGPTLDHPDRVKLDKATLSRMFVIDWDYDWVLYRQIALAKTIEARESEGKVTDSENLFLERSIASLAGWFERCFQYVIDPANGIKMETYFDPRALYGVAVDILGFGTINRNQSLDARVWKGLLAGTRTKILEANPFPSFD